MRFSRQNSDSATNLSPTTSLRDPRCHNINFMAIKLYRDLTMKMTRGVKFHPPPPPKAFIGQSPYTKLSIVVKSISQSLEVQKRTVRQKFWALYPNLGSKLQYERQEAI